MNIHTTELDKHLATVMKEITEAASKHDLVAIQRVSRKATELNELKEQMTALQQRIANLNNEAAAPAAALEQTNGKLREFAVEVTDGDIRQNLLKLTPYVRRGKVEVGEDLIIEALPSGERFQTVLSEKGNKLRARGEVARFYRDANVKADDCVILTEVAPGRWTLKKAPPGKYGLPTLFV